jgi:hypothetical protein
MNKKQRIVVLIGLLAVFLAGLLPPWRMVDTSDHRTVSLRYSWILVPPHAQHRDYYEPDDFRAIKNLTRDEYESAKNKLLGRQSENEYEYSNQEIYSYYSDVVRLYENRDAILKAQREGHNWVEREAPWSEFEPYLDVARLSIEWIWIVLVIAGMVILFADKKKS